VRARLAAERGSALVVAVMTTVLMMALGLAAYGYVDSESRQAAAERKRESGFNQADGLISAQTYVLSRAWPAATSSAYPTCTWNGSAITATGASTDATKCPNTTAMSNTWNQRDFAAASSWSTMVRDNGGASAVYWDSSVTPSQPAWDANGDNQVWVYATANVRGRSRTLVERVEAEPARVVFPKNLLTAGSFQVTTGGPKPFLQLKGATLALRCASAATAGCMTTTKPNQVQGPGKTAFAWGGTHQITPVELDYLRQTAIANGTYYATCPVSPVGKLVFVESGDCSYNAGNATWNSAAAPGMFVLVSGTLKFTGNPTYYGAIYMYNQQGATCNPGPFDAGGSAYIQGAILIDGNGCFQVGSNTRVVYDANAIQNITYYGNMALVRSSYRELKPGS
jgi:Tfp pilus assembly protein PilX